MALRLTRLREPKRLADLTPTEREQLAVCARLHFGDERPLAARFAPDTDPEDRLGYFELWDVLRDGVHTHDLLLHNVDSGAVFTRGTTEVVARRIQLDYESDTDPLLAAALQSAHREARLRPPGER